MQCHLQFGLNCFVISISCLQVLIVGNGAVGKSSMIQRYCRGTFTKSYKKTIGVDFLEKQLRVHGEDVRLMLWDTAGQEEFDCITRAYYRCLEFFGVQEKLDRNVSGAPRPASLPSPAWTGSRSSRWGGGRGRWRRSAATSPWCSS